MGGGGGGGDESEVGVRGIGFDIPCKISPASSGDNLHEMSSYLLEKKI